MAPVNTFAAVFLAASMIVLSPVRAQAVQVESQDRSASYSDEIESLEPGQKAPSFRVHSLSGDEISLEDYSGQFVILEFWATWCAPCYPKIPHLRELWSSYGGSDLQIIGVSLDGKDRASDLASFLERYEIMWPQVIEGPGVEGEITKLYNVLGIPYSYLIGPDGLILGKNLRIEQLVYQIETWLGSPE